MGIVLLLIPLSLKAADYSSIPDLREETLTIRAVPIEHDGIPQGAQRVPMLTLRFQASCEGDITVKYIRVHRIGPGDSEDILGIYALKGVERLTRRVKISSDDQTALIRFKNFTIPACTSEQIDIAADFTRTARAGGVFVLSIESLEDFLTTAEEIDTVFPLRTYRTPNQSVTPYEVGEVTVTFLPLPGTISAVRDEVLAVFQLEADTTSHQLIYAITLTNEGTAKNDDLRNLYLTRTTKRSLASLVKRMNGDEVTFILSRPFFLKKGQKVVFEVHGHAYTTQRTVDFTLEEPSDLVARPSRRGGQNYGE